METALAFQKINCIPSLSLLTGSARIFWMLVLASRVLAWHNSASYWQMKDALRFAPLEHRQAVFLSTSASESTGEEPTIGSVSAQVITNSGHAGPRVGSESALTKIWLREIRAQEGPDDKPFNP